MLKPQNLQSKMPIGLILIDPAMDDMSGLKAVKTIKSFYEEVNLTREIKLREPHIVFFTSYPLEKILPKAYQLGVTRVESKPLQIEQIERIILEAKSLI